MDKKKIAVSAFIFLFVAAVFSCCSNKHDLPLIPEAAFNVNGSAETEIKNGDPLIAEFSVFLPYVSGNQKVKPVTLKFKQPWSEEVHFTIKHEENGGFQKWKWKLSPVAKTVSQIKLEKKTAAILIWTLAAEESRKIQPGTYWIQAELIIDKKTKVLSNPVKLIVKTSQEPVQLDEISEAVNQARFFLYQGEKEKALALIDTAIEKNDKHTVLYEYQGDLLVILERKKEAMASYMKAIDLNENVHDHSATEKYQKLWEEMK